VDFNHPLAGKDLTFDVQIVLIRDATKEELAQLAPPTAPTPAGGANSEGGPAPSEGASPSPQQK
jgi:FKBP-type peptidyl-prolyl cis-trans isomerase 2